MISFAAVGIAGLFASGLTMYSGFGLGTLLLPVFALLFPVEAAVASTAIVHGANNVFKVGLLGKNADWSIVVKFGIPAIFAAFAGAAALGAVSHAEEIASYSIGAKTAVITPVKLLLGTLMLIFALFELLPRFKKLEFDEKYLLPGGVLSGFFGGLSGHQGALRSAFLAKVGVSTAAFVGTNAMIGLMVDIARIATYVYVFVMAETAGVIGGDELPLVLTGILAAFAGVLIGRRFLHKVTMTSVQTLTGILLTGIAIGLGAGII